LYATTQIKSISGVWEFVLECGAGLGLVLILRWFWWRINVWSEITATIAPFIGYGFVKLYLENHIPQSFIDNRFSFYFTVGFTTISWITVTFLTKPTELNHLKKFHTRVKPEGYWQAVTGNKKAFSKESRYLLFCWISSIIMTYSILFFIGELIFQNYYSSSIYFVAAFCSFFILRKYMNKI
ncbi:MAG: hypothetical protein KA792_09275, partial [Bacteroidales bacterium]|nr:hypothetical protein [Bacteroidales bacterium]